MEGKQWFGSSYQGNIKDKYHFISKLASGAFGIVYLAEDRNTRNHINITLRCEVCSESNLKETCKRLHDFQK